MRSPELVRHLASRGHRNLAFHSASFALKEAEAPSPPTRSKKLRHVDDLTPPCVVEKMRPMARPYVSHKKLCDNSRAAMLAAIEVYNKPQTTYREQVVTVLVVNAWELILKAALRKSRKNIFYKKKRGEDYRSLSLEHCIAEMDQYRLWPETVDGDGVRANLHILTDYRNKIIHLYVADDLNSVLYMFLQQSIVNYRDFGRYSWGLTV